MSDPHPPYLEIVTTSTTYIFKLGHHGKYKIISQSVVVTNPEKTAIAAQWQPRINGVREYREIEAITRIDIPRRGIVSIREFPKEPIPCLFA
jgi:hypothetical protein